MVTKWKILAAHTYLSLLKFFLKKKKTSLKSTYNVLCLFQQVGCKLGLKQTSY